MDGTPLISGVLGFVIVLFLVVLAILWFCLPFAVFGIKRRLDDLIHESRATRALTGELAKVLVETTPMPTTKSQADNRTMEEIIRSDQHV